MQSDFPIHKSTYGTPSLNRFSQLLNIEDHGIAMYMPNIPHNAVNKKVLAYISICQAISKGLLPVSVAVQSQCKS